jgi:hypothetical protein
MNKKQKPRLCAGLLATVCPQRSCRTVEGRGASPPADSATLAQLESAVQVLLTPAPEDGGDADMEASERAEQQVRSTCRGVLLFSKVTRRVTPQARGNGAVLTPWVFQEHAEAVLHACVALAGSLVADKDAASTAHNLVTPVLLLHAALLLTPTVPLELQVRAPVACMFLWS